MTKETAKFLLGILDGLTLSAGAPDFEQVAKSLIAARAELVEAVAEIPARSA
jgi:hypothetical protein